MARKWNKQKRDFYRILDMDGDYKTNNKIDVDRGKIIPFNKDFWSLKYKDVKHLNILFVPKNIFDFFQLK